MSGKVTDQPPPPPPPPPDASSGREPDRESPPTNDRDVGGEIDEPPETTDTAVSPSEEPTNLGSNEVGGDIDEPPDLPDSNSLPLETSEQSDGGEINEPPEIDAEGAPVTPPDVSSGVSEAGEAEQPTASQDNDETGPIGSESADNSSQDTIQVAESDSPIHESADAANGETQDAPGESVSQDRTESLDTVGARPDVPAERPDLYTATDAPPPQIDGPHESPEGWANNINPSKDVPGKGDHNCGECARAVQETWEGNPTVAASETQKVHDQSGESLSVMNDWAGASPEATSVDGIQEKLDELGPGSSAIVKCTWDDGGGHYFNAVNDNGAIKVVDGQQGLVSSWPPTDAGVNYNSSMMTSVQAMYFDSSGRVVR